MSTVAESSRTAAITPFRVIRCIGEGGMATVWEARHPRWGRIAVKRPQNDADPALFVQEAEILRQLDHPNIVRCHEAHLSNRPSDCWLAMELLSGPNLGALLTSSPRGLGEHATTTIAAQLCEALEYSYRQPVRVGSAYTRVLAHLDIKPSNVHLEMRGGRVRRVTLTDFGIAQLAHKPPPAQIRAQPEYLAPERTRGGDVGPPSDMFSLGVLMYQMLAGRLPFWGRDDQEIIEAIVRKPAPPVPGISADLWSVVERCMAKDPAQRFESFSVLRSRLLSISKTRPVAKLASAARTTSADRPRVGLLVSGVLMIVCAFGLAPAIAAYGGLSSKAVFLALAWFFVFAVGGVLATVFGALRAKRSGKPGAVAPRPREAALARESRAVVAHLRVTSGHHAGKEYPLRSGPNLLGRADHCDVALQVGDFAISREQGVISVEPAAVIYVESCGSNPIIVNGRNASSARMRLPPEASLRIGRTFFQCVSAQPGADHY